MFQFSRSTAHWYIERVLKNNLGKLLRYFWWQGAKWQLYFNLYSSTQNISNIISFEKNKLYFKNYIQAQKQLRKKKKSLPRFYAQFVLTEFFDFDLGSDSCWTNITYIIIIFLIMLLLIHYFSNKTVTFFTSTILFNFILVIIKYINDIMDFFFQTCNFCSLLAFVYYPS